MSKQRRINVNFLTKFSLRNAVAVFILSFLLILGGLYSFSKLKVELLPNIEFPTLSIEAIYFGASPEDVDKQVISKLEQSLKNIEGVKKIQSTSFENIGILNLEFPFNTDLDQVEQQINTIIKEINIPENVKLKVNRFSFGAFPIYNISLFVKGDENLGEIINEEVIPSLTKIPGVNSVSVGGLTEEVVQITVDREKASQFGLTLSQVKDQINQKLFSFPAGTVSSENISIPVRVEEKIEKIEELKSIELTSSFLPNAQNVKLKDLAKIEAISDKAEFTRYNLKDSLSMAITKKQDANTVEVAKRIIEVLNTYQEKVDYSIGFDSAEGIEESVVTLVKEGLLGALFASIAVLIFLRNFRATIIAIISIPLSLLVAAIFLKQLDISLNIMTLGGMAVAVGRVVDDSIVVIENIFRRRRKTTDGMSNKLVESSTQEILKAITSSTLTTMVVFLPLGLVGGITGEFFLPFALTVVFSLIASLLVSITIVPILAKLSFTKVPKEEPEGKLQGAYSRLITWSLNRKTLIIVLSILLLAGSLALVPRLGFTFLPNEEQKTLVASIRLPAATTLEKTNEVSLLIENMFLEVEVIEEVTAGIGSRDFTSGLKRQNQASYFITLKDQVEVSKLIKKLEESMRKITDEVAPGSVLGIQELAAGGPPSNNNVVVDLYSSNLEDLQKAAKTVEDYMNTYDTLKYVSNNFSEKQKQIVVQIDSEKASKYGVSGFQILSAISDRTTAVSVGTVQLNDEEREVQLTYDESISSIEEIEQLTLFSKLGPILLKDVAKIEEVDTYTSIQKLDGKIFARIEAQISDNNIQKVTTNVVSGVQNELILPESVSFEGGGGSDETVETFQQLGIAMIVAIGLVYLTMLITFGKARIPFIILSSLIFVPIGSLFGLILVNEPMSVSVMIGFLMLIGIVTTNAIVLVDRVNQNRVEKGMTIRDSLTEAGKTRLRPILMTAFATIAALIPLALTTSSGTLISKGLAITVIGGLTSSTLLTLIIVPVMYEMFFYKKSRMERQQRIVNN
jgi:hydrophobic/amphiphilic exporter-1 (mainly G- bacteria), HAE1 family